MQVLGVEFKNKALLFKVLGYARGMSDKFIAEKYKNIDQLVKTRLKIDDDQLAASKLMQLKQNYLELKTNNSNELDQLDQAMISVFITCYKKIEVDTRVLIVESVASALKQDPDQLKMKLDQYCER